MDADVPLDALANALLRRSFLLTALELHMEALEHGERVERLAAFFASYNPPPSLAAPAEPAPRDLDPNQLLQRLRESEEQLSLARYQLELAQETAASTAAQGPPTPLATLTSPEADPTPALTAQEDTILSFIVHQHLMARGHKLAAVTLAEEVRMPRTWTDVSPHLPQPPSLAVLLRYYYSAGAQKAALEFAADPTLKEQLSARGAEVRALTGDKERLGAEVAQLSQKLAAQRSRADALDADKRRLQSELDKARTQPGPEEAPTRATSSAPPDMERDELGGVGALFAHRRLYLPEEVDERLPRFFENPRIWTELEAARHVTDCNGMARVVGACLPHVGPGVIVRSREEMLPLLVAVIIRTDDETLRDSLLAQLFALVKKPEAAQRAAIVGACVFVASVFGRRLTEGVLVPQCWDSLLHKSEERRLLVAEFAGAVAPLLPESQRIPVAINILRPLLEDPRPAVRAAAVHSVASLVVLASDVATQLPEFWALFKGALADADDAVTRVLLAELLPKLADFCASFGKLDVGLVMPLVQLLSAQLLDESRTAVDRATLRRSAVVADAIAALVPWMHRATLAWAPFADQVLDCGVDDRRRFVLSPQDEAALHACLRDYLRHESDLAFTAEDLRWNAAHFLCSQFAPSIAQLLGRLSFAQRRPAYLAVLGLLDSFWKAFDTHFTLAVFLSAFADAGASSALARINALPALAAGLHARRPESELVAFFCDTLVAIGSREDAGWLYAVAPETDDLAAAAAALCHSLELLVLREPRRVDAVLAAIRELVVHRAPGVRLVCAVIFDHLAGDSTEAVLRGIILPALMPLVNDEDAAVRCKVARALASVLAASHSTEQAAKIDEQGECERPTVLAH